MNRLTLIPILFSCVLITSCNQLSDEVDNQINDIKNKKEEIDKATNVDTIIKKETDKIKDLDNVLN
jgi:PBP1b-binding outer membrane lipoprotein LpoB